MLQKIANKKTTHVRTFYESFTHVSQMNQRGFWLNVWLDITQEVSGQIDGKSLSVFLKNCEFFQISQSLLDFVQKIPGETDERTEILGVWDQVISWMIFTPG